MSLSNLTVKATYQGDGANDTFAIPFDPIVDDSAETFVYIRDEGVDPVTETLVEEGALNEYTLTGAVLPGDFHTNVVFNAGSIPTADQKVIIIRVMPLTQTLNLTNSNFSSANVNRALDRIVAMIQQLDERFSRVPVMRVTEQEVQIVLPEPEAEKFLRWNDAGTNLENSDFTTAQIQDIIDDVAAIDAAVAAAAASAAAAAASETAAGDSEAAAEAAAASIADHLNDTDDAHDASAISFGPSGTIVATNVQGAIEELDGDVVAAQGDATQALSDAGTAQTTANDHISDGTDAHDASAISFDNVASGMTATEVQSAIDEVEGRVQALEAAPAGGGGGIVLEWEEQANSPVKEIENNIAGYKFTNALAQELYSEFRVPDSYQAGNPITLKAKFYSPDTSGTVHFKTQSTLLGAASEVTSTTNQRTSTNTAVTMSGANDNIPQEVEFDLTDGSGEVNAVAVAAGDIILVRLYRDSADTATSDARFMYKQQEVALT